MFVLVVLISKKILPVCVTCITTVIIFECALAYTSTGPTPQTVGASTISLLKPPKSVDAPKDTDGSTKNAKTLTWNMRNKEADYSQYADARESLKRSLMSDIENGNKQDPFVRSINYVRSESE